MYKSACEKRGKQCWKRIEKNSSEVFWANPGEKIVLYQEIYDLSRKNSLGYMTIGIDVRKYKELCESALEEEDEKIIVLNAEGEKLFSGGNIKEQLMNIGYTTALMMFGVIIGLFPVLSFVSGIVTKPLKKVNIAMGKFREGDFEQKVEVETHDEVGEVALCFNQMVTDIKKLIDEKYIMEIREKESELTALQAQINPHFLYNTLDSLYWQAQEADNEEIAENILALSNLFRQVLGAGKSVTTVEQECELVKEYLAIQKMRFTKRMNFEMDIEKVILKETIPKLILQPFVENAVVHGLENMDEPCDIFVRGRKIEHGMEFVVEDTGIGMTKEQVKEILNTNDTERYRGQRVGRYAIKNVEAEVIESEEIPMTVLRAEQYIKEHYCEDISAGQAAAYAGITAGYLSTLFSQYRPYGFSDLLNTIRIEHACTYLEQGYLKNYEIAYKVGYHDEKYFSKTFKKVKSVSPAEYKKKLREG